MLSRTDGPVERVGRERAGKEGRGEEIEAEAVDALICLRYVVTITRSV